MRGIIKFTKIRYLMFLISILVIVGGIVGTISNGGYNLGIDFEAGLNQRIQIAPVAFTVDFTGVGDASMDMQNGTISVDIRSDKGVSNYSFPLADYPKLSDLKNGLMTIPGLQMDLLMPDNSLSGKLTSGLNFPLEVTEEPSFVNIVGEESAAVAIDKIRAALATLGNPQVQVVGNPALSEFMVRVSDPDGTKKDELEVSIVKNLENVFGNNTVVVLQSDYVGPRFSSSLASQSISLTLTALVLILIYIWFRFKLGFAVSAITALFHDVLIMLGFIGTFRMEVSTTTIAAVLTIIGYSLNDTIVVFDRIRENQVLLKGDRSDNIINISITQSLSRTIITSLTTLLAVLALYFFGSGSIKDFALNLIVGIVVGTYSSIFIASPVLLGWSNVARKRKAVKTAVSSGSSGLKVIKEKEDSETIVRSTSIPEVERKRKGKRKNRK